MKKKYNTKKGKDEEPDTHEEESKETYKSKVKFHKDESFTSEKAADNSLEYFLGSTYYLNELKKNIFIYYFTKKMRYVTFIGA